MRQNKVGWFPSFFPLALGSPLAKWYAPKIFHLTCSESQNEWNHIASTLQSRVTSSSAATSWGSTDGLGHSNQERELFWSWAVWIAHLEYKRQRAPVKSAEADQLSIQKNSISQQHDFDDKIIILKAYIWSRWNLIKIKILPANWKIKVF